MNSNFKTELINPDDFISTFDTLEDIVIHYHRPTKFKFVFNHSQLLSMESQDSKKFIIETIERKLKLLAFL